MTDRPSPGTTAGLIGGLVGWRLISYESQQTVDYIQKLRADREAAGLPPLSEAEILRRSFKRQYLSVELDGTRHAGWRVWFLIWLTPAAFLIATVLFVMVSLFQMATFTRTEAVVERVYSWEGDTPFDRGVEQYSPVMCYTWTDGTGTCATPGMRHRDWNFEVGSTHEILFNPNRKANVVIPGFSQQWGLQTALAVITLVFGLVALYLHSRVRRWLRGGAQPAPGAA